jgi:beta-mannosidase
VLCGNSEVEQQAAMFGAPREAWSPKLFHETLPALVRAFMPDAIYWPSSAHGGPFPHDARQGTTSYYGVGAYLRPLDDARRSEVRFATECLAFANVPAHVPPTARVHAPAWKARTPRDLGAGWDFDDVRDHYVARLFGQDPAAVRWTDHDHYLDLGRVATGEVMARTFGEWRRARSVCRGALVWFLRDLWAGAGWGVIDADGQPKPAYFFLKRALAPVAVFLSDEGTGGLDAHLVNDGTRAIDGELEVRFFRGEVDVGGGKMPVLLAPHAAVEVPVAALLEGFVDVTHAHRFGPPTCDVVLAELREGDRVLARALHRPLGLPSRRQADVGLAASYVASARGTLDVTVTARLPAYGVVVEADGYEADDAFFELAPARPHLVRLTRTPASEGASTPPRVTVRALDAEARARAVPA